MSACLKTKGFGSESTHLRDPERIDRLSGIVTISSVRAYPAGDHPDGINPVHIKKHPDTGQKVSSDKDMIISEKS